MFKELRQSYHEFMPMYPVNEFLADFIQILECKTKLNKKIEEKEQMNGQIQLDEFLRLANDSQGTDAIENKITVKRHFSISPRYYYAIQLSTFHSIFR